MKPLKSLKTTWQGVTGEEETPLDGDTPSLVVSMCFHMVLLITLALWPLALHTEVAAVDLVAEAEEETEELEVPEEFHFDDRVNEEIGAKSVEGSQMALSLAPEQLDISEVPSPVDLTPVDDAEVEINLEVFDVPKGLQFDNLPVKGHVGEGITGATGAIDRITHEILLSLEERKTLVVWLFDQSPSLIKQRKEILGRFDRIYDELNLIKEKGSESFSNNGDKPLLTSIIGFGKDVILRTKQPTDDVAELKKAAAGLPRDDSGYEYIFAAIYQAADQYKGLRKINPRTGEPDRNVMIIAITDEAGDDHEKGLDPTVQLCRRYDIPVYVIGVPAPFGRRDTIFKWVDPDPKYDQTAQWGQVSQGPESLLPERIKLAFEGVDDRREPRLDSGFGPFALTRICYETGGIYFAVHPNRNLNRPVRRGETEAFSAHLTNFFEPDVMRKYRPDYVSRKEYMRRLSANKARSSLIRAAQMSWLKPMEGPQLRFVKRDEASFANALTEAQKIAAKLEPQINGLYEVLRLGESDREKETALRWKAGYDLAMGRVMSAKVRTEAYNAMLAKAKRGMSFSNERNNVWQLKPVNEVTTGGSMAKLATQAREYLQRVVNEHPETPWALLAAQELKTKLGWQWTEAYQAPPAPRGSRTRPNNNNNNRPAGRPDERAREIDRKPKRAMPKRL